MKSIFDKDGGHYNIIGVGADEGMQVLRDMFPTGDADVMNFALFSTSGVHGTYTTIEEVAHPSQETLDDYAPYEPPAEVTFLIVHPRLVCLKYGTCKPRTEKDFAFLMKLRSSSQKVMQTIGN